MTVETPISQGLSLSSFLLPNTTFIYITQAFYTSSGLTDLALLVFCPLYPSPIYHTGEIDFKMRLTLPYVAFPKFVLSTFIEGNKPKVGT